MVYMSIHGLLHWYRTAPRPFRRFTQYGNHGSSYWKSDRRYCPVTLGPLGTKRSLRNQCLINVKKARRISPTSNQKQSAYIPITVQNQYYAHLNVFRRADNDDDMTISYINPSVHHFLDLLLSLLFRSGLFKFRQA